MLLRLVAASLLAAAVPLWSSPARAHLDGAAHEHCPDAEDVGANVECYTVRFQASTEVHPAGIDLIAYLFVPTDRPAGSQPAIVFAHGCSGMYSNGIHNAGLNSKHKQWVRQYTAERGYVSLHISSFHSRYLLPDTAGSQPLDDPRQPPAEGEPGGDDYLAAATVDGPADEEWTECGNGSQGVSEIIERPYDMDAGYDFLVGALGASLVAGSEGETLANGNGNASSGLIDELVAGGLSVDPERVFLYGTSHGGQAAMATAAVERLSDPANPMGGEPRFAGFLDYYGGCGLYGAFGGTGNSSWQPYAPFLMLHGEEDPIWQDGAGADTAELWANGDCQPRLAAARAAGSEALWAVLYAAARHSFDEVERDDVGASGEADPDFPDWLAKLHANYEVSLPFMEQIGRIAAVEGGGGSLPTLAEAGFHDGNPWFNLRPLTPGSAPELSLVTRVVQPDPVVAVADVAGSVIDLSTLIADPAAFYPVSYSLSGAPAGVSLQNGHELALGLTPTAAGELPASFFIVATTDQGSTVVPVTLSSSGGVAGELSFGQELRLPALELSVDATTPLSLPLTALVTTSQRHPDSEPPSFAAAGLPAGLSLDAEGNLTGTPTGLPAQATFTASLAGIEMSFDLTLSDAGGDRWDLTASGPTALSFAGAEGDGGGAGDGNGDGSSGGGGSAGFGFLVWLASEWARRWISRRR